ncbi:MAG: hypothetical protein WAW67_05340, partial [Candidatus Omnitrophota bacterium]
MAKTTIGILGMHCVACAKPALNARQDSSHKEIKSIRSKFILSLIFSLPLMYFAMATHLKLFVPEFVLHNMALAQFLL